MDGVQAVGARKWVLALKGRMHVHAEGGGGCTNV